MNKSIYFLILRIFYFPSAICLQLYVVYLHNIIFTIFIFPGTQVFYRVDESEESGKGANSVISMLHHHFQYKSYEHQSSYIWIIALVKTRIIL